MSYAAATLPSRAWVAISPVALLAAAPPLLGQAAKKTTTPAAKPAALTLDRVKSSGTLKLGYRTDARPFSFTHMDNLTSPCSRLRIAVEG